MLDLNELKHLVLFAEYGTLSRVAEACHISTPSITRSMKHLEERFGVSLFIREKSKIKLNETGYIAVEAAKNILAVKKDHAFAKHKYVFFSELNGVNFLIRSEIGFWNKLCHDKLPASRFLVQKDEFEFVMFTPEGC